MPKASHSGYLVCRISDSGHNLPIHSVIAYDTLTLILPIVSESVPIGITELLPVQATHTASNMRRRELRSI